MRDPGDGCVLGGAVFERLTPAGQAEEVVVEDETGVGLRLVPPLMPENRTTMPLEPGECNAQTAIHMLARRHPAASHGKLTARARRAGYVLNRKTSARLLYTWGFCD